MGATAMAAETANAASEVWCSKVPLKSLVKCFVTVGVKASGAMAEKYDESSGPPDISRERYFPVRINEFHPARHAGPQQKQQEQQAAMEAAKEQLEDMRARVQNCLLSLKEKNSSSAQSHFYQGRVLKLSKQKKQTSPLSRDYG
jgi:hypothetical protein